MQRKILGKNFQIYNVNLKKIQVKNPILRNENSKKE